MQPIRTLGVLGVLMAASLEAYAQPTTGNIFGRVVDKATGQPLDGVTVVATGPQGEQALITENGGSYQLRALPVGQYVVRFYMGEVAVEERVTVSVDKTVRADARLSSTPEIETIRVVEQAPAIDLGSSRVSVTHGQDFIRHVPNTLNVGGVLEKAPGAYMDVRPDGSTLGPSLSGATGAENAYYIDGLNVTSVGFGLLGSDLLTPFIDEVEIISGGYNAEYGRALSGVVNIVTKQGTNEWKGSGFSYVTPHWLGAKPRRVHSWSTAATGYTQNDYTTQIGAEVGGPIIKDKLFIWAGYAPQFSSDHVVRHLDSFVDADGDGQPDSTGGRPTLMPIGNSEIDGKSLNHQYAAKVTWRVAPEHQLSVGLFGIQNSREYLRSPNADVRAGMTEDKTRSHDLTMRWLSKFFDRRWQVEGTLGLHAEGLDTKSPHADLNATNVTDWFDGGSLAALDMDPAVQAGCSTNMMTGFVSCPAGGGYRSGGYGLIRDVNATRVAGQLKSRHIFSGGLGWHDLKYGADYELNSYDNTRGFSGPPGGRAYGAVFPGPFGISQSLFRVPQGSAVPMDPSELLKAPFYRDTLRSKTQTHNTGVFLQDAWSPVTNLTVNAGVRWETQRIEDYQGNAALKVHDMVAPRVGLVYDPTNAGRSKLYTHYGRFYESIPLDLNDRAFGGEGILVQGYPGCAPFSQGCQGQPIYVSAGKNLQVQKNIKGTHTEEVVLGYQHEVFRDLTVGAAVIRRWLGRVIEDAAGVVANPGDISRSALDDMEKDAVAKETAAMNGSPEQMAAAADARALADASKQAAVMPKPTRVYEALQLTASKRLARSWLFVGSYTLSRTKGNFPGLYAADVDQFDPNYTSQYDIIDLTLNRDGRLPNDRPHVVRGDGYYQLTFGKSTVTTGVGFLGRSGRPINHQGTHAAAGAHNTFVLPRGSGGRTPFVTRFDLHLSYQRKLTEGTSIDAFIDIFNVLNQQTTLMVDNDYTLAPVEPIIGGTKADLANLKTSDGSAAPKNPNYKAATMYQAPIAGRLGLRVNF